MYAEPTTAADVNARARALHRKFYGPTRTVNLAVRHVPEHEIYASFVPKKLECNGVMPLLDASLPVEGKYSLAEILAAVSRATRVSINDIKSRRRYSQFVQARMVYYYLARALTSQSYPIVGRSLGGRDHSTILHGLRQINSRMDEFRPVINLALNILGAGNGR